jgi:hypothetical protein
MLHRIKELTKYPLKAKDGEIGSIKEFYFTDQNWVIRYLVVDTGTWLPGKRVLVSPYAVAGEIGDSIPLNLTRKQVETSPFPESDLPVSRQFERQYYAYYGWPMYWQGAYVWGATAVPLHGPVEPVEPPPDQEGDPHLRSTDQVTGYHIQARDGEIGHVEDFIIDDTNWSIRYLLIDTVNWWPGKKVLLPPAWASDISWHQSKVHVDLDRQTIKEAPEYDPEQMLARDYEDRLHRHYNRRGYWIEEADLPGRRSSP